MYLENKRSTYRNIAGLVIMMTLIGGFIFARAVHSSALLGAGIFWLVFRKNSDWLWKNTWFISLFPLAFCVPLWDWINGTQVDNAFYIKLSLPLYVLFFCSWQPHRKTIVVFHAAIFILLTTLSLEALYRFYMNPESITHGYKTAKVMDIGYYADHIRISVFIAISCFLALFEYRKTSHSFYRYALLAYVIFQSVFLHFLSARTGLVVFYVSMFVFLIHHSITTRSFKVIAILSLLIALPLISIKIFPSFYHRMGYTLWDKGYYEKFEYREGSSDGLRYFSIVAGIDIFKENPIKGVGFHQLHYESHEWLRKKFPSIKESELLQPSSELLIYAASGGIVCLIILLMFCFFPLTDRVLRQSDLFTGIYLGLLSTFMFEIFLENQFGVFVFAFGCFWMFFLIQLNQEEVNAKTI